MKDDIKVMFDVENNIVYRIPRSTPEMIMGTVGIDNYYQFGVEEDRKNKKMQKFTNMLKEIFIYIFLLGTFVLCFNYIFGIKYISFMVFEYIMIIIVSIMISVMDLYVYNLKYYMIIRNFIMRKSLSKFT